MLATNETKTTLRTLAEEAKRQEAQVRELTLQRSQFRINSDLSVSSWPENGRPSALATPGTAAFEQLACRLGVPGRVVSWLKETNRHVDLARYMNEGRTEGDEVKFRLHCGGERPTYFAAVSREYAAFSTADILTFVGEALQEFIPTGNALDLPILGSEHGKFGEFTLHPWKARVFLDLTDLFGLRREVAERQLNDPHKLGIEIGQRGDGTASLSIAVSILRLVCLNGMTRADKIGSISVVHRQGNARQLRRKIQQAIRAAMVQIPAAFVQYRDLEKVALPNPHGALVALAEQSVGKRRVADIARNELQDYVTELGRTAYAVVQSLTHRAQSEPEADLREAFAALAGQVSTLSAEKWVRASQRGEELLAARR